MWRHSVTIYIGEAKCLMNHQYSDGASAERSRRRRAWQRSRTPNKLEDSGEILRGDERKITEIDRKSSWKSQS